MADISSAAADTAQNAIITSTTYYLGLNTGDPGSTGAHEGTDGRQAITFASSSGGTQASSNSQTWSSAVGGQTYTDFSIWTIATGGTYIRGGALTEDISPAAGNEIQVASGGIVLTAD